ncbi:MAG TPA: hypothetical protein VFG53_11860 [Anaeromyxobacter sp.]|nr:hypothetical protein [Anaeromyxobacter sp.]
MRKVFAVALPLGLALLAGILLSSSFRARDEAAEARSERARLKREFDERVALLRALPPEAAREWRDEVNVLLRGYLEGLSEIRNRYPRAPVPPSALEATAAERKGALPEKERAALEDFQKYTDSRLALLSGGAYAPLASVPGGGFRLDVLSVEPGASPAGGPGLRIDFALWGAPRLVERERSGSRTVSRTSVPVVMKSLQFRFLDASRKIYGEMSGSGEPYQKLVDPERFAPEFPPGVLFGTWWVELLPREAATTELKLDLDVRQPSGAASPVSLGLELPVREPWRIPPGTKYQAEVREAAPAANGK